MYRKMMLVLSIFLFSFLFCVLMLHLGATAMPPVAPDGPAGTTQRPVVESTWLDTEIEIDGRIGADEWAGAARVQVGSAGFYSFTNDRHALYIAADFLADPQVDQPQVITDPWDHIGVFFDGWTTGTLVQDVATSFAVDGAIQKGSAYPLHISEHCGDGYWQSGSIAVDDATGHVQYELQVPLSYIGAPGDTIGAMLRAGNQCLAGGCPGGYLWYPIEASIPWYFTCTPSDTQYIDTWAEIELAAIPCSDPYEPNDVIGDAVLISRTAPITAYICYSGDFDFYKFPVTGADGTVTVTLSGVAGTDLPGDYYLQLHDPAGGLVAREQSSGPDPKQVTATLTEMGNWYVGVWALPDQWNTESPYELSLDFGPTFVMTGGLGVLNTHLFTDQHQMFYALFQDNFGRPVTGLSDATAQWGGGTVDLEDDGTGGDFQADDGIYVGWKKTGTPGTYQAALYTGARRWDQASFDVLGFRYARLLALTDVQVLYEQFLGTGTQLNEDLDADATPDIVELFARLREYVRSQNGILLDLPHAISGYGNLDYLDPADRLAIPPKIDQLIADVTRGFTYDPTYLVVVGDDRVVPFYRLVDPKEKEKDFMRVKDHPTFSDTWRGYVLTDLPYWTVDTAVPVHGQNGPKPEMAGGRLFNRHPAWLAASIDSFEQPLLLDGAALFAYNPVTWDLDGNEYKKNPPTSLDPNYPEACKNQWRLVNDYIPDSAIDYRCGEPYQNGGVYDEWRAQDLIDAVETTPLVVVNTHGSNSLAQEAVSSTTASYVYGSDFGSLPEDLPGRLAILANCHAGYAPAYHASHPSYSNDSLVLWTQMYGVATIGPTTYGLWEGGPIDRLDQGYDRDAWTEQMLLKYLQHLFHAGTVGGAFRDALHSYVDGCGGFDKTDEYTLYSQMLYGLPTQQIVTGTTRVDWGVAPRVEWFSAAAARRPLLTSEEMRSSTAVAAEQGRVVRVDPAQIYSTTVGDGQVTFTAFGAGAQQENGGPRVPRIWRQIDLPAHAAVTGVQLSSAVSETLPGAYDLPPVDVYTGEGSPLAPDFQPVPLYPSQVFTWTASARADRTRVSLSVMPLQWRQATGSVTLWDDLVFSVTYTAPVPISSVQVLSSGLGMAAYPVGTPVEVSLQVDCDAAARIAVEISFSDPSGRLRGRRDDSVALPAGVSGLTYALPTAATPPGARYVNLVVKDEELGEVIYARSHTVQLEGAFVSAWLERSQLWLGDETAQLTVLARDETGALVEDLAGGLSVAVDGQGVPLAFERVAAGEYRAAVPVTGLAQGQHRLDVGCTDGRGIETGDTLFFAYGRSQPGVWVYLPLLRRR